MRIRTLLWFILVVCLIVMNSACNQAETENEKTPRSEPLKQQQQTNPDESRRIKPQVQSSPEPSKEQPEIEVKTEDGGDTEEPPSGEVVTPQLDRSQNPKVKGLYISGWVAGSPSKMSALIQQVEQSELNAVVIDVKDDQGRLTYDSQVPMANDLQSDQSLMIKNLERLLTDLEERNIYTIARLVVFKDPLLAAKKTNLAMRTKQGELWRDGRGVAWVDPYQRQVWDYNIAIAKEAAKLGFDEIQFDYVRYPENGAKVDKDVTFHNPNKVSKADNIAKFLHQARESLHQQGAFVSADVFGLTTTSSDDMGIGQDWSKLIQEVDYISPMVYPSHYGPGMYGVANPDLEPYRIISKALQDANAKNKKLNISEEELAIQRPWFQSFTAKWVHPHKVYGANEIKEQIRAAKEQGVEEYLLWDPKCKYTLP